MKDNEQSVPDSHLDRQSDVTATFDWAATPPSIAVIETLAEAKNVDFRELPSLYDTVDPDALDALFAEPTDATQPARLSFSHAECYISVGHTGEVIVERLEQPA